MARRTDQHLVLEEGLHVFLRCLIGDPLDVCGEDRGCLAAATNNHQRQIRRQPDHVMDRLGHTNIAVPSCSRRFSASLVFLPIFIFTALISHRRCTQQYRS